MSLQVFQAARLGLEATRGTPVTPTRNYFGQTFTHGQEIRAIRPETLTGLYEAYPSAATGVEVNTFASSGRMSFDELILHGNLFFAALGTASGTVAGTGGTAYTFTFTPVGTADTVKSATAQMGWNDTIATVPGVQLAYLLGDTLHLHWEKNDDGALTFDAAFATAGTASQISAFTGSPSNVLGQLVSMFSTQVYLDASTIGSTVDNNVVSVDWTLNMNPVPFYGLNNSAGASAVYRPKPRVWTATIRRQYSSATEWSIYQTKAERKVRIKSLGPAIGTAGTYTAQMDLYGVYTGRTWSDVDGIITEDLTLEPLTDTAAGTITNQLVVVTGTGGTIA